MDISANDIDGLSHSLNEVDLSDASPKRKFCSTCVKTLHYGKLPAADCSAEGGERPRPGASFHRCSRQKHARDLYEELSKQALSPASPVSHDGPTAQEGAHPEEGKNFASLVHHVALSPYVTASAGPAII
ncbi:hypothetical protein MY11210_001761 [Beauveria gryllotalpidicola]